MASHRLPVPVDEGPYVGLRLAGTLLNATPFELRNLVLGAEGDPPLLRSIAIKAALHIRADDVFCLARALAEIGLLHNPIPIEPPL